MRNNASTITAALLTILVFLIAGAVWQKSSMFDKASGPVADQETVDEGKFTVYGIEMTLPDPSWKVKSTSIGTNSRTVTIQTDQDPYNVDLVMVVKRSEAELVPFDEDVTRVKGGVIWNDVCAPGFCAGANLGGHGYSFTFNVKSNEPPPEDLDGIWAPGWEGMDEGIWDLLSSIDAP